MSMPPQKSEVSAPAEGAPSDQTPVPKRVRARKVFVPAPPSDGAPSMEEWLLSYSDMVTLLLIMFVGLLLNAHFDKQEPGEESIGPRRIIENLLQIRVFSPYAEGDSFTITGPQDAVPAKASDGQQGSLAVVKDEDLERIRRREAVLSTVRERLRQAQLDSFIDARMEGDGIRLNIPNSILFDTGAAELQGRGPAVLKSLAPILTAERYVVSVEGHTDNVPIRTERFPSNWELSAQRAATVVRSLADFGVDASRLQAVGFADSRPLVSNDTELNRRENRRVTVLLRAP